VLPKRHSAEPSRAKIGACSAGAEPSGAEPVVAVPPRPVLPKKRSTTFNSSPQLPRPTPDQEVRYLPCFLIIKNIFIFVLLLFLLLLLLLFVSLSYYCCYLSLRNKKL
jgi:hypothetical protein